MKTSVSIFPYEGKGPRGVAQSGGSGGISDGDSVDAVEEDGISLGDLLNRFGGPEFDFPLADGSTVRISLTPYLHLPKETLMHVSVETQFESEMERGEFEGRVARARSRWRTEDAPDSQ